jgi:hypothetical protein
VSAAGRAGLAIAVLSAVADSAAARPFDDWKAAAALRYDLAFHRRTDGADAAGEPLADLDGLALAGLRLRGLAGPHPIGLALGVDVHGGGGTGGGFAWEADLYPFGLGARLGRHGAIAILAGIGGSGVTDRIPAGAQFPIEAWAELGLGAHLRLAVWASAAWISGADAREDGAPTAPFGDELVAGAAFRIGRRFHDWGFRSGNGWFLGLEYAEQMGATFAGLTLGYSVDVATE